ncbi:glycosyltransferase family 2 protein (plasmid) [Halorarum halophilum]|uniref:Glycosyltransferase family 2 protein n=1 Tax=Halorarum halophilum TaxID=2743090 RepID=A0A7D5GEG6_9EURY|nr:glycosyltransferase family 2 protein [Halobaculum halophilum]QLG29792.1 glycosyltransferase family 2 protein [Halobaculum halophilum]
MYRGHTVGVAIPAYNEEGFVGRTLERVPSFVDRVYVVDDASTDGTWAEITETAERLNEAYDPPDDGPNRFSKRVVPIQHEENRGVGGAIKTGYQRAREEEIDVTTVMGGDDQMEPEMLDRLLDPIVEGRADYTKGNRFLNRTDREDMPAFRFVGNAILSGLTKVASGYWETGDPQSGYTAISLEALNRADIDGMYEFYGYCNDLLVKLNVAGLRVVDVPRPVTYGEEESDINYVTYIPKVSGMLLRNFLWRLRTKYLLFDFHPLVIGYAVGVLATLAGAAATLAGVLGNDDGPVAKIDSNDSSIVLWLVGIVSILWAMTLDMKANASLNDVDRRTDAARGDLGDPDTDDREVRADPDVRSISEAGSDREVGRSRGERAGDSRAVQGRPTGGPGANGNRGTIDATDGK